MYTTATEAQQGKLGGICFSVWSSTERGRPKQNVRIWMHKNVRLTYQQSIAKSLFWAVKKGSTLFLL